ncbi:hypothetical protein [Luteimonas suaedae]|uniref:hypothetical protein n=1 Tax=Luteimonas suaedae TaxID=2605430 RepID=UPI0011F04D8C|nr:hypothetical protein [Luteimonas suaedae]
MSNQYDTLERDYKNTTASPVSVRIGLVGARQLRSSAHNASIDIGIRHSSDFASTICIAPRASTHLYLLRGHLELIPKIIALGSAHPRRPVMAAEFARKTVE